MLKARLQTDFKPLDQLEAFVDSFDRIAYEVGQEAFEAVAPELRADLAFIPPKVAYPIQWTSDKQRRYYFAVIAAYDPNTGEVIPYRDTGRPSQVASKWRVTAKRTSGRYTMLVENTSEAARFVYGDINFRRKAGPYPPQQQFHVNTGWVPVQETVSFWFDAFNEEYDRRWRDRLQGFGFNVSRRRSR